MRNFTFSILIAFALTACGEGEKHDPPQTIDWDLECEGTLDVNACVTLVVGSSQYVRDNAAGDVIGTLFWGLYKEGDVDSFGIPSGEPAYSGEIADVDLSSDNRTHLIHIANVEARKYHPLLQLDDDLSGSPNDGDAVTVAPPAFNAPAGAHTTRNVTLGLLCSGGLCDP